MAPTRAVRRRSVSGLLAVALLWAGLVLPAAPAQAAPGFTSAPVPTVSGTVKVGARLAATAGTWKPAPSSLTYQWYAGGAKVSGATARTWKLPSSVLGKKVTVKVTAARHGYTTTTKASASTAAVARGTLVAPPTPTISGSVKVGATLTATPGTWGPSPVSLTFQWLVAGRAVSGATSATWTVPATALGQTVAVRVTGTKSGYTTVTTTSKATAAAKPGTLVSATPTISGSVAVASTLTATPGTWGPSPVSLKYQWLVGGAAVPGATSAAWTVPASARGTTVAVRVTGSKTAYTTVVKTSAVTAPVATGAFTTSPVPTVSGEGRVGQKLTAVPGAWAPVPDSVTYQWAVDGAPVSGATSVSWSIPATAAGKSVTVAVTARRAGLASLTRTSVGLAVVDPNLVVVEVSGEVFGTWTAGTTHHVADEVTVPAGQTLRIEPGAAVTLDAGARVEVRGALVASGATGRPVTFTLAGAPVVDVAGNPVRWTLDVLGGGLELVGVAARGGRVEASECTSGQVVGSTFVETSVSLDRCSFPVRANRFERAGLAQTSPLTLSEHDLTLFPLTGPDANTFVGDDVHRRVDVRAGRVPAGAEWVVDPASRAVPVVSDVRVDGIVLLLEGTTVKVDATTAFHVAPGGLLQALGTATAPVRVTGIGDDLVGGDTGGDGSSDPAAVREMWPGFASVEGGDLDVQGLRMTWLASFVTAGDGSHVAVRDSVLTLRQHLRHTDRFGNDSAVAGTMEIRACDSAEITGNRFEGVQVGLERCPAHVAANVFDHAVDPEERWRPPLSVAYHTDLSRISLSGADANTFVGDDADRRVDVFGSTVPAGSTWTVAAPTRAVLVPGGNNEVLGTVVIGAGSVVKSYGTFTVRPGGVLRLAGDEANPVVVTSVENDTVAGDTFGDGPTDPAAPRYRGSGFAVVAGGRLEMDHAAVSWLEYPVGTGYPSTADLAIRDSAFRTPQDMQPGDYSLPTTGAVVLSQCDAAVLDGNRFEGTRLEASDCPATVTDNVFDHASGADGQGPLFVRGHDDLAQLSFTGLNANTFVGEDLDRQVVVDGATVADGTVFTFDGAASHAVLDVRAPIRTSRALDSARTTVRILPGSVVKGYGFLFDLGTTTSFLANGTAAAPIVFTSGDDDTVGGDTRGDGSTDLHPFSGVFATEQGGVWSFALGVVGVDLEQVGPGTATVSHAVVKHAGEGFVGCLVCDLSVHETDFVDVGTGVDQAFYAVPVLPCTWVAGSGVLNGEKVWRPAQAQDNYWGSPRGPSSHVNFVELALAFVGQREQARRLAEDLPLEQQGPVKAAIEGMVTQVGDTVPNIDPTDAAAVGVHLQSCTIPVLNVTFVVPVVPESFIAWYAAPIHGQDVLATL